MCLALGQCRRSLEEHRHWQQEHETFPAMMPLVPIISWMPRALEGQAGVCQGMSSVLAALDWLWEENSPLGAAFLQHESLFALIPAALQRWSR